MDIQRAVVYERDMGDELEVEIPIGGGCVECVEMRLARVGYCVTTRMWIVYLESGG